jgi:flagellar hook-length control protein FliK
VGSAVNPYANLVQPDVQPAEDELVAFDPQAMTQVQSAPLEEDAPAGNTEPQVVDGSLQVPEETVETVEEAPEIAPETVQKAVGEQPEVEIRTVKAEDTQAPAEDGDDTHVEGYEAESAEKPLFKDAEAAPIKVGERYEVDTESTDMDNQLANSIRQAMSAAVEKVEIRLAPEHLGAVTIEMGRDANGALQVVLHTATGKAANLLTEHLDSLHAALQNMGHDAVHVEVQRNEESAQQQSMHQQADPDGHNQQKHPQQQRQQQSTNPEDFMQQLRLGLFSLEDMV